MINVRAHAETALSPEAAFTILSRPDQLARIENSFESFEIVETLSWGYQAHALIRTVTGRLLDGRVEVVHDEDAHSLNWKQTGGYGLRGHFLIQQEDAGLRLDYTTDTIPDPAEALGPRESDHALHELHRRTAHALDRLKETLEQAPPPPEIREVGAPVAPPALEDAANGLARLDAEPLAPPRAGRRGRGKASS